MTAAPHPGDDGPAGRPVDEPGAEGGRLVERVADDVAAVRAFVAEHRLPRLVDVHVHGMPENVLAKVWGWFDRHVGPGGQRWPIRYRAPEPERTEVLRAFGLPAWPTLLYPHRPGMAAWLLEWAEEHAAEHPEVVPTGTFFPEPEAPRYVARALDRGVRLFKAHLEVGQYDPRDPHLHEVWGQLEDAGVPVVVHCGDGPVPGPFTGPGPIGEVLAAHPRLVAVVAHLGMPQFAEFLDLAERFPHVHLDTTMALTDFSDRVSPCPPDVLPRYGDLGDRVVFGSDFPNIPYSYAHPLERLAALGFGEAWLRAVCCDNGARLLRLDGPAAVPGDPA